MCKCSNLIIARDAGQSMTDELGSFEERCTIHLRCKAGASLNLGCEPIQFGLFKVMIAGVLGCRFLKLLIF